MLFTSFTAEPCGAWYDINYQMYLQALIVSEGWPWDNCGSLRHRFCYLLTIRPLARGEKKKKVNLRKNNSDERPWETIQGPKALRTGKPMFICNHICDVWQHSPENSHCCAWATYSTKFQLFSTEEVFSLRETEQGSGRKTTVEDNVFFCVLSFAVHTAARGIHFS